jgi:hypothetical protein
MLSPEAFRLSAISDGDENEPEEPSQHGVPPIPPLTPSRHEQHAQKRALKPVGTKESEASQYTLTFFTMINGRRHCNFCM